VVTIGELKLFTEMETIIPPSRYTKILVSGWTSLRTKVASLLRL
jgi:hypothetical protein